MSEVIRPDFGHNHLITEAVKVLVDYHRITSSPDITVAEDYMDALNKRRDDVLSRLTQEECQTAEEVARSEIEESQTKEE